VTCCLGCGGEAGDDVVWCQSPAIVRASAGAVEPETAVAPAARILPPVPQKSRAGSISQARPTTCLGAMFKDWEAGHERIKELELELSTTGERMRAQELELGAMRKSLDEERLVNKSDSQKWEQEKLLLTQEIHTLREELAEAHGRKQAIQASLERVKADIESGHAMIAEQGLALQEKQARIAELEEALARQKASGLSQMQSHHSQLVVLQLLHASISSAYGASCLRITCSAAALNSRLYSFREWVKQEFMGTRVSHRRNPTSVEFCDPPEYEIIDVEVVTNPVLAERQRLLIQQEESREPSSSHRYRAHRLIPSLREGMKLPRIRAPAGEEGFDEGMLLGWHGAKDEDVAKIVEDGFNTCCAGRKNGAGSLFGKGIYFAENSSKADLYAGPECSRFKRHTAPMSVILAVVHCGNMYEVKAATREMREWVEPPAPTAAQSRETGIKRCA
jgi:hypothetical protein